MKRIVGVFLMLVLCTPVFAKKQKADTRKKFTLAEEKFNNDDYAAALPLYLEVLNQQPDNFNVRFKVGVCYLNSASEKNKAEGFLEEASKKVSADYREQNFKEKNAPPATWLYLGQAYHFDYKFDKAAEAFAQFKSFLDVKDATTLKEVERWVAWCTNGTQLMMAPVEIEVKNTGRSVNSSAPDFSPVITADESQLIFTTRRPGTTGGKLDPEDGLPFEDIYVSDRTDTGWGAAHSIGSNINTAGHDAAIGLSADGQQLFIYKDDGGDGNIYISTLNGNNWGTPVKLNDNVNSKAWEPSACISADGSTLYFTSNREGGFGGRDIYRSIRLPNGEWGKPVNLGPTINTPYDEDAPSIQADGVTLYYASNGMRSMGGFDIFYSVRSDDGNWGDPVNVGYPVNTTDDDIFYVPTADNKHAYYSSFNNQGFGEKDIYQLTFPDRSATPLTVYTGTITSIYGGTPEDAIVTITDNETGDIIGTYKPNTATGKYLIILPPGKNYNISYEAEGYLFSSENMDVSDTFAYQVINRPVELSPIKVGQKITLKNIFFESGKSTLKNESKVELGKLKALMDKFPKLVVQINGHTDASGSDELNMKLSQQRAEVVVKYLVDLGVEAKRLRSKGYGETQPIAINYNPDGTPNRAGMALNRRFEFEILSVDGILKDAVEKVEVPDKLKNH